MNEEKKQGKHIKLIIFIGLILVILVLNHIFGWSEYIGNINNLKKLDEMVENNLPVALALYMGLTIVGCVALALPGITFAIAAGLLLDRCLEQSHVQWRRPSARCWHLLQEDFS